MEEKDMNQKKKPDDPAEQETGKRKSGLAREGIAYLIFGVLTTVIDYVISNTHHLFVTKANSTAATHAMV